MLRSPSCITPAWPRASFTPSGMPADLSHAVSISTLGTAGIAAVTFVVLGLALLTSWVDRRFAAQTLELQEEKLQRSEAYLAEAQRLTHTGSWAWRVAGRDAVHLSEEWYRIYGFDPENGPPAFEEHRQRTHPGGSSSSGKEQSIEQSLKSRNTKWNSESFFQTALSNTSTPSAILF